LNPLFPEFIVGANLPWLDYGFDFGANGWRPAGGVANNVDRMDAEFSHLSTTGVTAIRWFIFCDGRAGIEFDASGTPLGLDQFVIRDLAAALDAARRHEISVMPVLFDFLWCARPTIHAGVQQGGRAEILRDPQMRAALFERIIGPVLEEFGQDSSILAWDVINEPEWITRGLATNPLRAEIDAEHLRAFLEDAIDLVHAVATQPVTVGSAGAGWYRFYRDLDLDFHQVHWYDSLKKTPPLDTSVDALGFEKPVVLGEFPTRCAVGPQQLLESARSAGYAGAFYWSALSNDACSDPIAAAQAVRSSR
jgi:hypothetical protein